jgi:hypothetical protein
VTRPRKDILTRLADAGEDAIARLADTPGADRMLGAMTSMRDRMDEMQRRIRGIDELEQRVAELERRLDAQQPKAPTRRTPPATKSAAAKPKPKQAPGSTDRAGTDSPG